MLIPEVGQKIDLKQTNNSINVWVYLLLHFTYVVLFGLIQFGAVYFIHPLNSKDWGMGLFIGGYYPVIHTILLAIGFIVAATKLISGKKQVLYFSFKKNPISLILFSGTHIILVLLFAGKLDFLNPWGMVILYALYVILSVTLYFRIIFSKNY